MAAMEIYAIVKLYSDWADNEYDGIEFSTTYEDALKVAKKHTDKYWANYVEMYRLIIANGVAIAWEEITGVELQEALEKKVDSKSKLDVDSPNEDLKPDDYIESE